MVVSNEDSIYNAIIIAMIIGTVLTIIVLIITFEKPEPFTEIYFEDSENLPEKAGLNQLNNFAFTIHSLEDQNKNYGYDAKLEIYTIYDVTEGMYNCLSKYRDKTRMEWKEGSIINNNTYAAIRNYLNERPSSLIKQMHTEYLDEEQSIEWEDYIIEYGYQSTDGKGQTNAVFTDIYNNFKYAIIFSESTDGILFLKVQDGKLKIEKKSYNFEPGQGYSVKIVMNNSKATLYLNRKKIFTKSLITRNLKLNFETKNTYANIRFLKVSRENATLKDISGVTEYEIDGGDMKEEQNKLIDKKVDYLKLEMFNGLSSYSDAIFNSFGVKDNDLIQSYTIRRFLNTTEEIIDWKYYDIEFSFRPIEGHGNMMLVFRDLNGNFNYGLMISEAKQEVILITTENGKIKAIRKDIEITKDNHAIRLSVRNNKANVYFDNNYIISKSGFEPKKGTMSFELKNSYLDLNSIVATNLAVDSSDPTLYQKYIKKYAVTNKLDVYSQRSIAPITGTIETKNEDSTDEILERYAELMEQTNQSVDFFDPDSDFFIDYDKIQEINDSFNPYIQETKISFDGYQARIYNWTDYTFSFDYFALDGIKEVDMSFQNFNGDDRYSFTISEQINKTFFVDHNNDKETIKDVEIDEERWHNVQLQVEGTNTKVLLDRREIYSIDGADFTNGQFVLETKNTYAHFRGANVKNNDGQLKRYTIEEDPCQLKKTGEQTLAKNNIELGPGKSAMVKSGFTIQKLFDYGKVSVQVGEQEIHFWVSRT